MYWYAREMLEGSDREDGGPQKKHTLRLNYTKYTQDTAFKKQITCYPKNLP